MALKVFKMLKISRSKLAINQANTGYFQLGMEVEVRVVRARVWLSSSLFLRQDGFLSLATVDEVEHVAHATLRSVESSTGEQFSIEDATTQHNKHKHIRSVTIAWEEQSVPGGKCQSFHLPERKANQPVVLPRLHFQLFVLKPRSRDGASARSRPQTTYIGSSGWQLSEKDVEALVSSREVVFLTTLLDDLGTLEVKLRCANNNAGTTTTETSGFSINWSSSKALQEDIAVKARLKAEADKKLIAQLKQTAMKAAQLAEGHQILIEYFYRSQAVRKIQRQYRELLSKRREVLAKLRREEEARIAEKKAKVRDKVISRNRQRALEMRAKLSAYADNNNAYEANKTRPKRRSSNQESKLVAELMKAERTKLYEKLEQLENQRRQLTRSNQKSPKRKRENLFDDELIQAVQELHFSRSHAGNQLMQQ